MSHGICNLCDERLTAEPTRPCEGPHGYGEVAAPDPGFAETRAGRMIQAVALLTQEGYRVVKLAPFDEVMYEYSSIVPMYIKEEL